MAHYFCYALAWIIFLTCLSTNPSFSNAISHEKSENINANDNSCTASAQDLRLGSRAINQCEKHVSEKPATPRNSKDFLTFQKEFMQVIKNQSSGNLTEFREWSIEKVREFLAEEMAQCQFEEKSKEMKLDDLIPEQGGKPIQSVILSTWRSGSTFLGDIINSHPGSYYHCEPLRHYGAVQLRSGRLAEQGTQELREFLNCRFTSLNNTRRGANNKDDKYRVIFMYTYNPKVGQFCKKNLEMCRDISFHTRMCRLFPYHVTKLVHTRLAPVKSLLEDTDLNIRLLLLIRDPRGTMQSRRHHNFCLGTPDCASSHNLCSDMEADFHEATKLRKEFPGRFMALRYEDISLNPYSAVEKLFKFFRLRCHSQVERFLDSHTKFKKGNVFSTYRNSKTTPFHWREDFSDNFDEVKRIQFHCEKAMDLWGYRIAKDNHDMMTFNPLNKPPWEEMIVPEDENRASR